MFYSFTDFISLLRFNSGLQRIGSFIFYDGVHHLRQDINHLGSEVTRNSGELHGTIVRIVCVFIQINFSAHCNAR